jgi:methionine aminopeptidase
LCSFVSFFLSLAFYIIHIGKYHFNGYYSLTRLKGVMEKVIEACQPGKRIAEICMLGNKLIEEYMSKIYTKVRRGIAFPTCISVNNCCGHFSPLSQDPTTLKEGDVVKVYVSFNIDHSIIVFLFH